MDLPPELTKPDLSLLNAKDTIPSNINSSTISFLCEFLSTHLTLFMSHSRSAAAWHHSVFSATFDSIMPPITGVQAWTIVDIVLVRLNTSLTPSGKFPVYSDTPPQGYDWPGTRLGFDAAVCVQRYEPWILEAYNATTGPPHALGIIGKVNTSVSVSPSGSIRGARIANTGYLNTTGKEIVIEAAHINSVYRMLDVNNDQGHDWGSCAPTPAVGPAVPLQPTSLLTLTYFTDCFFHGREWNSGIHRTVSNQVRRYPRTGGCS